MTDEYFRVDLVLLDTIPSRILKEYFGKISKEHFSLRQYKENRVCVF